MPLGHARYYSLDGMRGFVAIVVLLHHFGLQLYPSLAPRGYLAVDFFFALSGFVVALAYQDRLNRGLSIGRFMALRAIRLYPLFLMGVALGAIKAVGQILVHDETALSFGVLGISLLFSLMMLPTPAAGLVSIFPLNTPGWSLFFEMVANLGMAVGVGRWPTRRIALAAAIAGLILAFGIWRHGGQVGPLGPSWKDFAWGFPRVAYAFLTGILLFRLGAGRRRMESLKLYVAIAALILLLLANPRGWLGSCYEIMILGLAIPALLWAGVIWEAPRASWRLFAWLGDISYPLYVLHFPLLMAYLFIGKMLHFSTAFLGLSFVACMLPLSAVALRLYDAPTRALLGRWLRKMSGARRATQIPDRDEPASPGPPPTSPGGANHNPAFSSMQR